MIHVVAGRSRARARVVDGEVVVRVTRADEAPRASAAEARVTVAVADPRLARALTAAIARAVRAAAPPVPRALPVVRFRTLKRLALVGPRLAGAIAVVRVTAANARRIGALLDGARAAGAAGVQLAWDGVSPGRDRAEAPVFAALESARAAPAGMPVVLARTTQVTFAVRALAAARAGEGTVR